MKTSHENKTQDAGLVKGFQEQNVKISSQKDDKIGMIDRKLKCIKIYYILSSPFY